MKIIFYHSTAYDVIFVILVLEFS
uniref:Uncharacterized protein n=1 Tax=Rhizophora mucronata TaxID=61149 RepID=A0A2P2PNY2_RHIMU